MLNEDPVWVNLSPQEIEDLRNKKYELTEYGKEQLRKLMMNQEPYPDEMFEEAERREAANKVPREEIMKLAVGFIGKYSEALKQLAETEKVELRAELEAKKKENFQLVADACMEEYRKKYGEDRSEDEYWVYMIAEYFGTGEGQTTCVMMTQATPYGDDFPSDGPDKYKAITSQEYRAVRKFHEKFGTWMLYGLKFLSKEDFLTECAYFLPPVMMKLSNAKCYKEFYTEVHYNFS
jgi:DNA-binding PadR family transcriptional regulator